MKSIFIVYIFNFLFNAWRKEFTTITLQNGQTHLNDASAVANELFECDYFVGLAHKGLKKLYHGISKWLTVVVDRNKFSTNIFSFNT